MAKRRARRTRRVARRGAYRFTPKRRYALKQAQLVSARQRKGHKKLIIGAGVVAGVAGAAVLGHKLSGSSLSIRMHKSALEGEPHKTSTHTGPLRFDSHGFRSGGGEVTTLVRRTSRPGVSLNKRGNQVDAFIRPVAGKRAVHITYVFGRRTAPMSTARRARPIDRSTIPMYNYPGRTKGDWPSPRVSPATAKRRNRRLAKQGLLHHFPATGGSAHPPAVVGPYSAAALQQKRIRNKYLRSKARL